MVASWPEENAWGQFEVERMIHFDGRKTLGWWCEVKRSVVASVPALLERQAVSSLSDFVAFSAAEPRPVPEEHPAKAQPANAALVADVPSADMVPHSHGPR